jgi:hypothetical protein
VSRNWDRSLPVWPPVPLSHPAFCSVSISTLHPEISFCTSFSRCYLDISEYNKNYSLFDKITGTFEHSLGSVQCNVDIKYASGNAMETSEHTGPGLGELDWAEFRGQQCGGNHWSCETGQHPWELHPELTLLHGRTWVRTGKGRAQDWARVKRGMNEVLRTWRWLSLSCQQKEPIGTQRMYYLDLETCKLLSSW